MKRRGFTRKYILIYTALFALLCVIVFFPFVQNGKCLVGKGDGQSQYILQLEYMGRWLRQALQGFWHGDFTPPRFDFAIGMGDDITSVVRFHPLDFLSVFVPEAGTEFLYQFLIFLRLYLAGLSFSLYCFAWKKMTAPAAAPSSWAHESWAVLAGSMVYLFTGYTFSLGIVHPTYLSPLITLPLLLLGAERMMHREKEHRFVLFSVMTAVSFISNYYFMYIASVAAVIYVFVRFFQIYKENRVRQFIIVFFRFVFAYGTGALISCITLLPVLKRYGSSYRSQHLTTLANLLFYADRRRYAAWLINLITPLRASGNGTHLNYIVLVFPAILLLFFFSRREDESKERASVRVFLRIAAIVLLVVLLLPAGGYLLAAMNNENNRWVFLIALLCGGIVSFSFPDFFRLQKHHAQALTAGCVVYDLAVMASFFYLGFDLYQAAGAIQLTITTILLLTVGRRAAKRAVCTLLMCICVFSCAVDGIMTFARPFGNLTRFYQKAGNTTAWYRKSVYANYLKIPGAGEDGFCRVDGVFSRNTEDNAALLLGYHGIQMYNSVMNTAQLDALMETDNVGLTTMLHIKHLDGRSAAQELAAVRYYMVRPKSAAAIPYGYSKEPVYQDRNIAIYENQIPLSVSYGCSRVMAQSEYEKLSAAQKEYVCLDAAVIADEEARAFRGETLTAQEYSRMAGIVTEPVSGLRADTGIRIKEKKGKGTVLKVKNKKSKCYLTVRMRKGYACYLALEDVSASQSASIRVKAADVTDMVTLLTDDATYTLRRSDYLVNLGNPQEDADKELSLRFTKKGTYRIGSLRVVYIPMEGYEEKVGVLRLHAMQQEQVRDDVISGTAEWDQPGVQLFSVPYSDGWKAEVDGKPACLLKADSCWMGLVMEPGVHTIRLIYRTPMLDAGAWCSALGLAVLILAALFFRIRKRRLRTDKRQGAE